MIEKKAILSYNFRKACFAGGSDILPAYGQNIF